MFTIFSALPASTHTSSIIIITIIISSSRSSRFRHKLLNNSGLVAKWQDVQVGCYQVVITRMGDKPSRYTTNTKVNSIRPGYMISVLLVVYCNTEHCTLLLPIVKYDS